jgi:hypothetical protein
MLELEWSEIKYLIEIGNTLSGYLNGQASWILKSR